MELYCAIMNILDFLALNDVEESEKTYLFNTLDNLLKMSDLGTIDEIASANDCGRCDNWKDFVNALRKLHKSGERV